MAIALACKFRRWLLVSACAALIWAHYDAQLRLGERLPAALEGRDQIVEGVVASLPEHGGRVTRFNFDVEQAEAQLPRHIRLSWYDTSSDTPQAGQRWRFTVRLKRPHGSLNPGGFDYERWLFVQNLGATGYVRNPQFARRLGEGGWPYALLRWRHALSKRLEHLLPDSANLGLLKALTIGDGQAVSEAQWEMFRNTGTVHLVVISGTHIALLAGWVYLLLRKLWAYRSNWRYSPPTVASVAAMTAGFGYALLAGFALPAQRAAIMALVGLLAIPWQRQIRPGQALALAALLIVATQPVATLVPGFWLSFAAVLLIVYALAGRQAPLHAWRAAFKVQWALTLGLAPWLLLFFQQVAWLSLPANLLAVPIVGFITTPLALLGLLAMPCSAPLAQSLLQMADGSLQALQWALQGLLQLAPGVAFNPQPNVWQLLCGLLASLVLLLPRGLPGRPLGLALCLPLLFPLREEPPPAGTFKLALLDVGQGLAAVVQTQTHNLLFDTGAKYPDGLDMGRSVVLPYLWQQGIRQLDMVLVSHGDNDHSGGLQAVIQGLGEAPLLSGDRDIATRYAGRPCEAGQHWQWDGVGFTVLAPPRQGFDKENDNSCVLQLQSPSASALLTGDIEAVAENWLAQAYRGSLRSEVLVAPHHGSKTSSTAAFLNQVKPKAVLIPAGYRNRFGFPHPTVLQRYRSLDAEIYDSARSGTITVLWDGQGRKTSEYRQTDRRYWQDR